MPPSQMIYIIESVPVNPGIGVKIKTVSFIVTDPLSGREVLSILTVRMPPSGSMSLINTSIIIWESKIMNTVSFTAIGKLLSIATNTIAVSHKIGVSSSQTI